jgi:hypothetical protein
MGDRYDFLFKFIVIGDAAVGKSCILHRFIEAKCALSAPSFCFFGSTFLFSLADGILHSY